ncbi:MAG: peptidoglycan DD-metalloendopeptidase family protein [Duncaniella sp.]|nr:peptidoglycan DD-metalloendopeptidase family protein [Duncaniella sp.]
MTPLNVFRNIARTAAALLLAVVVCASPVEAKKKRSSAKSSRTVENVQRDKKKAQQQISETSGKIKANTREINRQVNRLGELNTEIDNGRRSIERLNARIDTLSSLAAIARDSVTTLEGELETMRQTYVKALRRLQPEAARMNSWAFVLSAKSFNEAYQNIRYLRQFSAWRQRKAENIREVADRIAERRTELTRLHAESDEALRKVDASQRELTRNQAEAETLLASLKKEDASLRQMLKEQKQKAAALDRELDRIIAEEQRRAAEEERRRKEEERKQQLAQQKPQKQTSTSSPTQVAEAKPSKGNTTARQQPQQTAAAATAALTGSFADNKGRLLFPVAGKYRIVRQFGRHPHPTLPHVETDNSGIDIEVSAGTQARAVFGGKVSAIFKQDGFNSIIMVRHGKYITIYAGLDNISVKQGDNIKAGQNLGTVFSDPDNDNRAVLHFEIRNERQKLNPTQWVK